MISSWSTGVPPSLVVARRGDDLDVREHAGGVVAVTATSPPAATSESSIVASARLETLLLARMPPTLLPVALNIAAAAELAAFDTVAFSCAAFERRHRHVARRRDRGAAHGGRRAKRAAHHRTPDERADRRSRRRSALKRKFCAFQPIELNANVTATASRRRGRARIVASMPATSLLHRPPQEPACTVLSTSQAPGAGEHDVRHQLAVAGDHACRCRRSCHRTR